MIPKILLLQFSNKIHINKIILPNKTIQITISIQFPPASQLRSYYYRWRAFWKSGQSQDDYWWNKNDSCCQNIALQPTKNWCGEFNVRVENHDSFGFTSKYCQCSWSLYNAIAKARTLCCCGILWAWRYCWCSQETQTSLQVKLIILYCCFHLVWVTIRYHLRIF